MIRVILLVAAVVGVVRAGATALGAVPAVGEGVVNFPSPVSTEGTEAMKGGKFEPTWESLAQYRAPEWYRDAKFGIWAHWGAQCEPEDGDWYARHMYIQGTKQYEDHLKRYGHPSKSGFKDVIHEWKAEHWDPEKLMALYKRAGAQYFVALANHHDNFDNFDSKYQPWNSTKVGPMKDLIGGWAKAARDNGLRFGVSIHAAHAWSWYEVAQGSDKTGPLAGVPYDGKLRKADGAGQWWEGLDPQDLYAQDHVPGRRMDWDWDASKGSSVPDVAYCDKFYNRSIDLINKYQPDLVYFDDTALPLYPVSDAGLKIAAHFYNSNMALHGGKLEAVLTNKVLTDAQKKCMVWDIERGQSNRIEPLPWQTDTCIGNWHYDRSIYEHHRYKSTKTVVQMLCDIVSKNGNLLLSIPVRADGTIDEDETKIVEGIADWMGVNREAIFGTRPWKVFGEGPAIAGAAAIKAQGFNEGKGKGFSAEDVRFTSKGDAVYAIVMDWPGKAVEIRAMGKEGGKLDHAIGKVTLLGSSEPVKWSQNGEALSVEFPEKKPCDYAYVLKVE